MACAEGGAGLGCLKSTSTGLAKHNYATAVCDNFCHLAGDSIHIEPNRRRTRMPPSSLMLEREATLLAA